MITPFFCLVVPLFAVETRLDADHASGLVDDKLAPGRAVEELDVLDAVEIPYEFAVDGGAGTLGDRRPLDPFDIGIVVEPVLDLIAYFGNVVGIFLRHGSIAAGDKTLGRIRGESTAVATKIAACVFLSALLEKNSRATLLGHGRRTVKARRSRPDENDIGFSRPFSRAVGDHGRLARRSTAGHAGKSCRTQTSSTDFQKIATIHCSTHFVYPIPSLLSYSVPPLQGSESSRGGCNCHQIGLAPLQWPS